MSNTNQTTVSSGASLDALQNVTDAHWRTIALSAGDFRVTVAKEVDSLLNQHQGNQLQAANAGLQRLQAGKWITNQEVKDLEEIVTHIYAAQFQKEDSGKAAAAVHAVNDRLRANTASSPVALVIAGIAASGPSQLPAESIARAKSNNNGDIGMVGGAIAGAAIGGALGGFGGAIIGGVVGGIAGGIAGACKK